LKNGFIPKEVFWLQEVKMLMVPEKDVYLKKLYAYFQKLI